MAHTFQRRRGTTLLECVVCAALLSVLLSIAAQALVQLKRQSRTMEDRTQALELVENALEEVTARPWPEIDAAVAELKLPEADARRWPSAVFAGSVAASADPAEAKRVTLTLTIRARSRPVTLTTWVYRAAGD